MWPPAPLPLRALQLLKRLPSIGRGRAAYRAAMDESLREAQGRREGALPHAAELLPDDGSQSVVQMLLEAKQLLAVAAPHDVAVNDIWVRPPPPHPSGHTPDD